jgi:hypothetical protein
MKTVVQILSAAFSGSTLLDAMLDSQPGVIGLGEVAQLWESKPEGIRRGPCHLCLEDAGKCSFWKGWHSAVNPFDYAFQRCPEATVAVDSSKQPVRFTQVPEEYLVRKVILVKTPHEWAASVRAHHREKGREAASFEECFYHWKNLQAEIVKYCDGQGFLIRYTDLTRRPAEVLADLCLWAGIVFDPAPLADRSFWQRKSHALGGNPAVIDQVNERGSEMTSGRGGWLGGKYLPSDRWRTIHYDDAWSRDLELRQECERLYREGDRRLDGLLARLGLGGSREMADLLAQHKFAIGASPQSQDFDSSTVV